jgi:hypothetical protein
MSNAKNLVKNLDRGFYHEARQKGMTPLEFLAREVALEPPEVEPVAKRKLATLHQVDDDSYRARAVRKHAEEAAALSACIRAAGIEKRDRVEKFFASDAPTALFPIVMANSIIAGQLASSLVPFFAAMEEDVDGQVIEKVTINDTESTREMKLMGEGANIPETFIERAEGTVRLYKYGRALKWSYEAARRLSLPIIALFLQRIGIQMGISQTNDMIEVLIAGDGTTGSAVVDTDALVSGTLDYNELIRLTFAFPLGYRMARAVASDTMLQTIFNMAEFKDPQIQVRFQERGLLDGGTPLFGAIFHRWNAPTTSFSTDRILAVDDRYALSMLREGDLLEESDRIIDKQLNLATITEWRGFKKLDNTATQCLDVTT